MEIETRFSKKKIFNISSNAKAKYIFIILVSLFLIILCTSSLYLSKFGQQILSYPNIVSSQIKDSMRSISSKFSNIDEINYQNLRLKNKLSAAERYKYQIDILENENKILKEKLNYYGNSPHKFITAKVLNFNKENFRSFMLINIGSKQNIKKHAAVTHNNNLIGTIKEVFTDYSIVKLIDDIDSKIPVKSVISREKAILIGDLNHKLNVKYTKPQSQLLAGELLVTIGDGKYIPSDLTVAKIDGLSNNQFTATSFLKQNYHDFVMVILTEH